MGIYADVITEKKQQVEKILGAPYDCSRYTSPSDCPPQALNPIADIKVCEAEDRQAEIREEIGGTGSLTATAVPPEKWHLIAEHEELAKQIGVWKPHRIPAKERAR